MVPVKPGDFSPLEPLHAQGSIGMDRLCIPCPTHNLKAYPICIIASRSWLALFETGYLKYGRDTLLLQLIEKPKPEQEILIYFG